eukprot:gb/GECG01016136.1/.p1 GENE.gb/GECG01016136.1/~~gb/GECG01016136.1/.p1  ORF type:complete len:105 (+),score=11.01 gb/GECG01016136.1/:1-315(+)
MIGEGSVCEKNGTVANRTKVSRFNLCYRYLEGWLQHHMMERAGIEDTVMYWVEVTRNYDQASVSSEEEQPTVKDIIRKLSWPQCATGEDSQRILDRLRPLGYVP